MKSPSLPCAINGEEPNVVGQVCTGFFLQHFYEDGQIVDQVNVAYLRFEAQWYRLYFECGTVFWRASEKPALAENSGLDSGSLLNDLSGMSTVIGHDLRTMAYTATQAGDVGVCLGFSNGEKLHFCYSAASDSTRVAA
jgi:hypothetical protein